MRAIEYRKLRGVALNRRRLLGYTGSAGMAAFLAACGEGYERGESGPAAQRTSGDSSGTQAAAQPEKPTGTVTIVQSVDANTLDPSFTNATPEGNIDRHIYDMLLWRDAKTLKPVPRLAEEFRSVDPTTWEFKLRPNMTFHDGTRLDAEAVQFSLDRYARETIGGKPTVPRIRRTMSYDTVEVIDATTFRIKTTAPSPVLPDVLTGIEIVSPAAYQADAEVPAKAVGSGPYKFVEWKRDQQLVVEVNPDWWGPTQAFERIIFKPVAEVSTRILQLKNGEADLIVNVPPDNAADIDRSEKARISKVDGARKIFVGIRTEKHPALGDKRVRQAMNHALNFDAINHALLNGSGTRMTTYFNPPHEPPDAKAYDYNIQRAKDLLAQAGYPNGFNVEMHGPTGRYIKDKEIAQAVAQDLDKVGIKVDLKILEWSVYAGNELTRAAGGPPAGLYFLGFGGGVTGVEEALFFHPDQQVNFTDWKNSEYFALVDKLKVEMDEQKFQEHINQINEILWDEVPWIGIWNQVDYYGASRKLLWDGRRDERIVMFEARWKG
jgi:peptide/nickel transport system substrate-binding protein